MSTTQLGGSGDRPGSPNALPLGTRLGDFEVTGMIGEGGFGIVYLAFDNSLHRKVALKEYMPSALANRMGDFSVAVRSDSHEQTFRAGLRSFINEARLLAQFDHPALIKVYTFWEQHGTAYMAMQLYEGRTLKDVLRETPKPDEAWLKGLLSPLLDALETLHAAQCYHRDIAPDNILILKNGNPVLLDFGAARRIIGDMTQAVTVILKPGYAPIEQYADDATMQQGPWTDVYALSAVLHLAISGKAPPASVTRMINDPMKPLRETISGYSEDFLAAIERGLIVRPEQRPQSIAEFRTLLGVSTLAPGAGSWTMSPTTVGAVRSGPVTSMQPPVSGPQTRSGPVSQSPAPVSTGSVQRNSISMFGGLGSAPAAPPVANAGAAGSGPPPTSFRPLPEPENVPRSPMLAPAAPKRGIPGALLFALAAIVTVGIGVAIYFAISSSNPPPLTMSSIPANPQPRTEAPPPAPVIPPPAAPATTSPAPATAPAGGVPDTAAKPEIPPPTLPVAPPPPATVPAPAPDPEDAIWENARTATTRDPIDDYLKKYPNGKYKEAAKTELLRFTPLTVRVNLSIKPWGEVILDGVSQGASPPKKNIELEEGKHKIEIRNGSQSFTQQVEVKRGQKAISLAHEFN